MSNEFFKEIVSLLRVLDERTIFLKQIVDSHSQQLSSTTVPDVTFISALSITLLNILDDQKQQIVYKTTMEVPFNVVIDVRGFGNHITLA